ncbi:MAG TPA: exopolysaccharide Pel transporter PelG [Fluviicoccus sp.]|nr:exopolysaccharide Pel transporter PelG [Fluviicoccus sp.]
MAGIGYELRKLMARDSLLGMVRAYAYAGIISSGPWVLSILGILLIGLLGMSVGGSGGYMVQFQVSITYIIAASLIFTGFAQLAFTRFTADRLFEKNERVIRANLNGLLLGVTISGGLLSAAVLWRYFPEQSLRYKLLMMSTFVLICHIWIATLFLSGIKQYKAILLTFAVGYGISVALAILWRAHFLEGMLAGFLAGQFFLLMGMLLLIHRNYPAGALVSFEFMRRDRLYPDLILIGFLYNLGVWLDKLIFWFYADTSISIIGPLRASPIYDIPVFLAYLSIIPGMAVLLVKMETDFVDYYEAFYDAVRSGGSLEQIENLRNDMVHTIRQGIYQIINIQAVTALAVFISGATLLPWLGISPLYLPLLFVNLIAVSLQVVFLGILGVLFYLDKRRIVLALTAWLVLLNGTLTVLTLHLGPTFYGYGFAAALALAIMPGFWMLDRKLATLEYETFMLQ